MKDEEFEEILQSLLDQGVVGVDMTLSDEKWAEYGLYPDAAGYEMNFDLKGGKMTVMLWKETPVPIKELADEENKELN